MLKLLFFQLRKLMVVLTIACISSSLASAQAITVDEAAKPEVPPTHLVLTPQAAPQPALKYLLLPPIIDQRPGNAVVHYGKIKSEQNAFFSSKEVDKAIQSAATSPLSELKTGADFDQLVNLGPIFSNMQRGARSEMADWQLPLREAFFTELLLPEVQEQRQFVRILYGRARVQIARGDYEGAIESMQTGVAMGRHVSQGPTLINGLVGLASIGMMLGAVQEMIAQPGAPNMYWALAELPYPMVDVQRGLEAERYLLYYTEPAWLHPEKMQGDESFWRRELERLWNYTSDRRSDIVASAADPRLSLYAVRGYADSKQRLIARGFKPEDVESMPVAKVILLDALHQYNCNVHEAMCKARQALAEPSRLAELRKQNALRFPEPLPVSRNLGVGTLGSVAHAILRIERHRAAIQVVEALRLHASETGKLPDRLQNVTSLYLPPDPTTGLPFAYELTGDTAVLSSSSGVSELKLHLSLRSESK